MTTIAEDILIRKLFYDIDQTYEKYYRNQIDTRTKINEVSRLIENFVDQVKKPENDKVN